MWTQHTRPWSAQSYSVSLRALFGKATSRPNFYSIAGGAIIHGGIGSPGSPYLILCVHVISCHHDSCVCVKKSMWSPTPQVRYNTIFRRWWRYSSDENSVIHCAAPSPFLKVWGSTGDRRRNTQLRARIDFQRCGEIKKMKKVRTVWRLFMFGLPNSAPSILWL